MGNRGVNGRAAPTPAIAALRSANISFITHEYGHDQRAESFADEAAQALGVDPARVFKTLVIADSSYHHFAVAVVPATGKLSLKAAGSALSFRRPTMADPADVRRVTGYVLGGVSPLGQRKQLPTAVDESVLRHATIFCSAGRRGFEVELSGRDLIAATQAVVALLAAP